MKSSISIEVNEKDGLLLCFELIVISVVLKDDIYSFIFFFELVGYNVFYIQLDGEEIMF